MTKLSNFAYFISTKIDVKTLTCSDYIGVDNMLQNKNGITQSKYLPDNGYAIAFQKNDILIGNIRPYLKKIWLATFDGGCSQDVLCLRCYNSCLSGFIFSLLSQDCFFDYVMKGSKGTRMARGDKKHILNYKFCDISNKEQIGKLITDLNKKIFINNKINDNLSQQCRTVFNFFFEQNHGQVSSKQKLSKVIKKVTTGLNPRQNFKLNTPDSTIKYITVKNITDDCLLDFEGCDLIDETARDLVHKRSNVAAGDILFSSIAPLGRCYLVEVNPNLWEINESVFCITPDLEFVTPEYLFLFLSGERIKKIGENLSTGSIFKGIRIGTILDIDIKLPSKEYIQEFTKIVRPLLIKRDYLMRENLKLRSIRDYLLPLLLNGQVKIK